MAAGRDRAYVGAMAASSNIDLLAWFSDDERHECPSCRERASVSLPDVPATFCLACGAISVDGVPIEITQTSTVP
jgi:hypothetical protein